MNSVIKKLAGQTVVYGLSTMLARFINYMLLPLHTAVFIPSDYGVVSALYAYVSLMNVLFTYGMETGFFRFATHEKNKQKVYATAQISVLVSSVFFGVLISFFAPSIAALIGFPNHADYVICFAWVLALDAISAIPFARLRLENRPVKYGMIKLINVLVNVCFTVWFLIIQPYLKTGEWFHKLESDSIIYVFICNLIASAVTLVVVIYMVRNVRMEKSKSDSLDSEIEAENSSGTLKIDFVIWKKMLLYSLPLLIVGLAGMVNEAFDRVLLLNFLPFDSIKNLSQVGIYSASYKISILMTLFVQAYRMAAEPFFFNESKKLDAKIMYARTMNYFVIACSIIFVFVMCSLDIFKTLFLRDVNYFEGLQIVPILLLANLCLGVYYNLTIWYKLTDKTLFGSYISVMGAVITISLNFYLIPKIGYLGSAWATLACYACMMIASYFSGQKFYHVPYDVKKFLVYVGLALLIGWFCNPYFHQLFEKSQLLYIVSSFATVSVFAFTVIQIERRWNNPEWNSEQQK